MNQRVPHSGGLPLRAMVMVLLFLAVVFLLLGINAVLSDGDSDNQATSAHHHHDHHHDVAGTGEDCRARLQHL